jgi:hypothetical protein
MPVSSVQFSAAILDPKSNPLVVLVPVVGVFVIVAGVLVLAIIVVEVLGG